MWRLVAWGAAGLLSLIARAEIIDRIAISVGNQVITESQIEEEIRITAFLNRSKVDISAAAKKQAADQLIEQALVKRDMEFSRYPMPALSDADASLQALKKGYGDEAQYRVALESYGIGEDALKRRLAWQLTLLRFIDFRFRPGIQIQDADIEAYYRQQLAKWQANGQQQIPKLEDTREEIGEALTQQRIDEALDRWLADVRMQVSIRYVDEALQ